MALLASDQQRVEILLQNSSEAFSKNVMDRSNL